MINKLVYAGKKITNKHEISDTMNRQFCDIGVRLPSKWPNYGNRFLEYHEEFIRMLWQSRKPLLFLKAG